jgi:transposase InsO family protein
MKVSKSGYYDWLKRKENKSDEKIGQLIREMQEKVKYIYGYRRVKIVLEKETGLIINHKAVYRIMAKYGLQSIIRRKYRYKCNQKLFKYDNLLNRNFKAEKPNEKWTTDITYINTKQGRLYLSVIKDVFDGSIISYRYMTNMNISLVTNTIKQAVKKEKVTDELTLHSDQGFQYTSIEYSNLTKEYGITPSMSRAGTPIDNAPIESFFSTLKSECLYRCKLNTISQTKELIDNYIDFYNNSRIQLKSKMTPIQRRKNYLLGYPNR